MTEEKEMIELKTVPLLMHSALRDLEKAYESNGDSPKMMVPEPLVPLQYPSSEENIVYSLWYLFDYISKAPMSKIKWVVGEADLGIYGRPDLLLFVDDDVWCIEVKERIGELRGRDVQQLLRYLESPYVNLLVVAYLKWCREDDELTRSKVQYLLERGIGVFYITPFGKVVLNENWAPHYRDAGRRSVKVSISSRYEELLRFIVYKHCILKGFGMTLEAPLRDLEVTYLTHSLAGYERPRWMHRLPRIDLVVWDKNEDMERLKFVGIEIKTSHVLDMQQLRYYSRSSMLSELYIAVPTMYADKVKQVLERHGLNEAGVIAVDEDRDRVEIVKEAKEKSASYKYFKYVQVKNGCLIVEDPTKLHRPRLPRITPSEALFLGLGPALYKDSFP